MGIENQVNWVQVRQGVFFRGSCAVHPSFLLIFGGRRFGDIPRASRKKLNWGCKYWKHYLTWRIIPFSKMVITMVIVSPLTVVIPPSKWPWLMGPINGGDPNYLHLLGAHPPSRHPVIPSQVWCLNGVFWWCSHTKPQEEVFNWMSSSESKGTPPMPPPQQKIWPF